MLLFVTPVAQRRFLYFLGPVFIFCLAAALWYAGVGLGLLFRSSGAGAIDAPSGTTPLGYYCGVVGGLIIAFEMYLWVRKKYRGRRAGSLRTRHLMILHIWLGLACLPLAIIHSGFAFGGHLSGGLMVLFLLVIASGVWGLAMQQVLPQRILDDIPNETIATERVRVGRQLFDEAVALVDRLRLSGEPDEEADEDAPVAVKRRIAPYRVDQLIAFFERQIAPYLQNQQTGGGPLASSAQALQVFVDLRRDGDVEFVAIVDRLESICASRRQLDRQYNLYWWLHSWLCIHVPLSWALCVVLVLHVGYALKYW